MGFTDQKWGESNGLKNSSDINLDKYNKITKFELKSKAEVAQDIIKVILKLNSK